MLLSTWGWRFRPVKLCTFWVIIPLEWRCHKPKYPLQSLICMPSVPSYCRSKTHWTSGRRGTRIFRAANRWFCRNVRASRIKPITITSRCVEAQKRPTFLWVRKLLTGSRWGLAFSSGVMQLATFCDHKSSKVRNSWFTKQSLLLFPFCCWFLLELRFVRVKKVIVSF